MEIGSFIEMQFPKGKELFEGEHDIARLNSGRAAIWHALRCTGCRCIWLPYYQCDTVSAFLERKNAQIKYYHMDEHFDPVDLAPAAEEAVLLVNYFGIMSERRMRQLASGYAHVIIDNSQALYARPIEGCYQVYSCRKFVGVPDGAYVIGPDAERFCDTYGQGFSSDTALFMLQRIEYGCEGKAYESRGRNEERIDTEDILRMSVLTRTILQGTDYPSAKEQRCANFDYVHSRLREINRIDPVRYYDSGCVPMVYPLVVEDDGLLARLQAKKHFQGHWWGYLLSRMQPSDFEYWLSRYIVPVTIDQRYTQEDMQGLCQVILAGESGSLHGDDE